MAALEIITGPLAGMQIPVARKHELIIGRDGATCDIVVGHSGVSRRHARLVCHDDGIYVEDLNSINGTFLNTRKLDRLSKLSEGDRVTFHDVSMIFHATDAVIGNGSDLFNMRDEDDGTYFGQVVIEDNVHERKATRRAGDRDEEIQFIDASVPLTDFAAINGKFTETLDAEEALVSLLELVFETLPEVKNGRIMFVGDDNRITPWAMKHGRDDDTVVLSMQPVHDTLANHVIYSGLTAVIFRDDTDWAVDDKGMLVVTVPISLPPAKHALGVLHLELHTEDRSLTEDELQFLSEAAFTCGQTFRLAKRHTQLLEQAGKRWHTDAAAKVQHRLLPQSQPDVSGYTIADHYAPANNVGGDFYCYCPLPGGRLVIVLGDVCGKGVAAALVMAELVTETRNALARSETLKEVMARLNRAAFDRDMGFVTYLMCVLDPKQHVVTVANAGHLPPLLREFDSGTVRELLAEKGNIPFGGLRDQEFHPVTFELAPGDAVMMFTDGVNEAADGAGHLYGLERTRQSLVAAQGEPQQMIDALLKDIGHFCGSADQTDDRCVVCLRRSPTS